MKKLKYAAVGLVLLIALVSFYIGSHSVNRSGTENLPVSEPVEVIYDNNAIPHIYAQNEADAYRALGYVHAKDRLFQMEMIRRLSAGRLSEILGPDLVKIDTLFRTIGLRKTADDYYESIDKESDSFRAVTNYLEGVNHYIENGKTPVEFTILGIEKEKYTHKDVLMIAGYMAYSFAAALKQEPLLSEIRESLGPVYLSEIPYSNRDNGDLDDDLFDLDESRAAVAPGRESRGVSVRRNQSPDSELHRSLARFFLEADKYRIPFGIFHGSNAMAVSPGRSQTGHSVLVSDPHIAFSQPSTWFEAHISTPDHEIYGHYLAMVPVPLLGHNRKLSWGLTMFENDDMDLYYETVNPANENEVLFRGRYQEVNIIKEVIKVKGEDDVVLNVRWTRNGPVLNDAIESLKDKRPVSLKWEFHNPSNRILEAFYRMEHADSINEFEAGVSMIRAPGLNVVYADAEGNIAWWAAGRLPVRPPGADPALIQDGSGRHEYLGYRPFYQNPQSKNPARGFIVSANQQPDTRTEGYYVHIWRAYRLHRLMRDEERLSVDDLKEIHSDVSFKQSKVWMRLLFAGIEPATFKNNAEREAYDLMMAWDGNFTRDSAGAVIVSEFISQTAVAAYQDELGEDLFSAFEDAMFFFDAFERLSRNSASVWWDDINTEQKESRADIVRTAWSKTIASLQDELGSNVSGWQWGDYHTVEYVHAVGRQAPMNYVFNVGPLPAAGSHETVYNTGHSMQPGPRKVNYGPSTRRIIDMGSPDISWGINPTGQSGVFTDPYYSNQKHLYLDRGYREQWLKREDIEKHKIGTLMLTAE